jgi:hypothetical protein
MKKILLLLLITIVFISCSKDEATVSSSFEAFSLKSYVASPMVSNDAVEYETGDIVWRFNFESQQLQVQIADGIDALRLETGTYNFSLNDNTCNYDENPYFHVDSDAIGLLIMDNYEDGLLTISDACIDGPIYRFERLLIP